MKSRCLNPKHHKYPLYGGRGIKICKKWLNSFEAFYLDLGPRPDNMTLDRRDSDKDYTPSNCRWATPVEQNINRKARK